VLGLATEAALTPSVETVTAPVWTTPLMVKMQAALATAAKAM